jgi:glycerophosphoryl diester phosphodiesterase
MPGEIPTDEETVHWTLKPMPLRIMVCIDGKVYRLMGKTPAFVPAARSTGSVVMPTQTEFSFYQDGIGIVLNFLSPVLAEDMDLVSRPLNYISWTFASKDKKNHSVEIYFEVSGLATVDNRGQQVVWEQKVLDDLQVLKMGSKDQPILEKSGDDLRIDWGYLYVAAAKSGIRSYYTGRSENSIMAFAKGKDFPQPDNTEQGKNITQIKPVLAFRIPVSVSSSGPAEKHIMLAYDDIYSVEYFGEKLEGYWKKRFNSIDDLLKTAEKEYVSIKNRCRQYDSDLYNKARDLGGNEYADICALAYRQCMAAHKVVKKVNGEPLCFSKENFSGGLMGTVDVFYPASPFFLYLNPDLMKAQTTPIFEYAGSGRWPWPYAPHDIGRYPLGNGQKYGGGEKTEVNQMPIEESGNMLILAAAIAMTEGNANYAGKYWNTITKWAGYLLEKGFDPENQLCTDDFAGHLAHNANLSIKAIMGIKSYARLSEMQGLKEDAANYNNAAKEMILKWINAADDGDHFRLAFDRPGTWSQKYNMVWDDILSFNIIPEEVENREITYYLKKQEHYGLPLDNRDSYTKLDWILWTASLANSNDEFRKLIKPVHGFLNETPDRLSMTDWYWTKTGEWRGFIARSVIGGVYMELLKDKMMKKRTGVYKPDSLPTRGLCAHRGAMETYPENTIPAFMEAIRSGAHMIEFDVYLTRDKKMVVIHDPTVDRTTNGTGKVSAFTLEEIKKLDAGGWKSPEFTGVRIPEIHEVLKIMPVNIWLNIHLKDEDMLAVLVAKTIEDEKRLHQAFLACSAASAKKAREAVPGILICNMDRQDSGWKYVWSTIGMKADFIQLTGPVDPVFSEYAEILKKNGVRINYFGTDSPGEIKKLFEYGVEFPLVNNIPKTIDIAAGLGLGRVKPVLTQ